MNIKFNFIINCADADIVGYEKLDIEANASVFSRSDLEWCLQTYLFLKKSRRLSVQLSNRFQKNAVNIIHSVQLLNLQGESNKFIVCIKADFPRRKWAHYHIVQNNNQLRADTSLTLLWIQPGLIKRDPARQGVSRVAYAGQTFNGNLAGDSGIWQNLFSKHGIEFVTLPSHACHDLSSIDVLIGIRSFDTNPYNSKPPSKLINAWHARIPFIGGYDSAFMQVGKPGEDYLLAKTADEAVQEVLRLRADPKLYKKLVQNGMQKIPLYNNETIAENWEKMLTGPITARYEKWQSNAGKEQTRFNTLLKLGLLEHNSKQVIKKLIGKK